MESERVKELENKVTELMGINGYLKEWTKELQSELV